MKIHAIIYEYFCVTCFPACFEAHKPKQMFTFQGIRYALT